MRHLHRRYELDMTSGPIAKKLLLYAIPLMATGILQLLYNAADMVVVGNFAGHTALAAVGATASLINLLVNLFIGLSVGASVTVARFFGAHRDKDINETVHTAMGIAVIAGVGVGVFGFLTAKGMLGLMDTPEDVIDQATTYLRIYFLGMPASLLYNFGAAILRAVGDTKRPLLYLALSGIVNVVLNLVTVIGFGMGVGGVAIATVASQVISAALVVTCLCRSHGALHLRIKDIRFHADKVRMILKIGLPAGIQSTVFAFSNVMIQSSVNAFGSVIMAGNTAASNIDSFISIMMSALADASLSFTGQNIGAGKYRRIGRIVGACCALVAVIWLFMGSAVLLLGRVLLGIYNSDPQVIDQGMIRLQVMCISYALCGWMNVFAYTTRATGHSVMPMLVTVLGVCGVRITWILTAFAAKKTLFMLYLSYPISWFVTLAVHMLCFFTLYKRLCQKEPLAPKSV